MCRVGVVGDWSSNCVLAGDDTLARSSFCGGDRCATARPAADCAWLLSAGRVWAAPYFWAMVFEFDGPPVAILIWRFAHRFRHLQLAVRGTTFHCGISVGGPGVSGHGQDIRRDATPNILARGGAAVMARDPCGHGLELRTHAR